jgi:hypothetical protein
MLGSVSTRRQKSGAPGGRSPVDDVEAARLAGHAHHGPDPAVDVRQQVDERRDAGHEEGERLEDVGPHDGLHAAGGDVDDRHDGEDGQRRHQRPAHEDRHGQGRGHQPHPGAGQPGHEEEQRRRDLGGLPEPVGQEFKIVVTSCR